VESRQTLVPVSVPDPFCYTVDGAVWVGEAEVVVIPPGTDTKVELLDAFAEQLRFPRSFRPTWDDLELCLRDLSWLGARTVVVLHTEVPPLPHGVLEVYLDVLQSAALLPGPGSPRLVCVFPAATRERVASLVSAA